MDPVEKAWLKHYPAGVPAQIDPQSWPSLVALLDEAFERHAESSACVYMGQSYSYRRIDDASRALGAWLQGQGLQRGDRVALMMPNTPQYLVAVAAVLRAGLVVVNVNPLHSGRELEQQLKDCGARALILLENFALTFAQVRHAVPVKTVLLTSLGEMLPLPRRLLVDTVVRHVRKQVPDHDLAGAVRFKDALHRGERMVFQPARPSPGDIALLQYTGGTTGVSKGAVLLHRNLVANVLQCEAWFQPALQRMPAGEQLTQVCALPLHHIFGFSTNLLLGLHLGACNLLIADSQDLPALFKALEGVRFHSFAAMNPLFHAMAQHPDLARVDWSHLRLSVGGGMAVQPATARLWLNKTGCPICEGYGLSETSPTVSCNPTDSSHFNGSVGLPLPGTEVSVLDEGGVPLPAGVPGEIAVRGPQVMAGYWQRPDETAKVMTVDGFLRTGDIGLMDERGYLRMIDRKKDRILVSGFSVYPSEVEDLLALMPGVVECAVVGVQGAHGSDTVKAVIVRQDDGLTEVEVRAYCEQNLTGYKRPKVIEFRRELPKTAVGKVLRRELRSAG
ncbi:MAG: AMP-binding protein [Burkholderiales bacterium]|jgi:long-chain acyl-CoA synthetase|nr:AMP-binding protein [Burkholderiales bacterium]MBP6250612.1 AMP-binding protein [Leptothrix sp. (in: b-proteobacteria)]MBP7521114.1 AMP-binding protein [Leptothrix sp. (in: b-proteobacteria)]HQY09779.1 AMP-binding protein [Burkholderiaceae bacterium]